MKEIVPDLSVRVEDALTESEDFDPRSEIDVIANGDVVTLQGTVPSRDARRRTESIAKRQKGVTSVINELNVDPNLVAEPAEPEDADALYVPPRNKRAPGA